MYIESSCLACAFDWQGRSRYLQVLYSRANVDDTELEPHSRCLVHFPSEPYLAFRLLYLTTQYYPWQHCRILVLATSSDCTTPSPLADYYKSFTVGANDRYPTVLQPIRPDIGFVTSPPSSLYCSTTLSHMLQRCAHKSRARID